MKWGPFFIHQDNIWQTLDLPMWSCLTDHPSNYVVYLVPTPCTDDHLLTKFSIVVGDKGKNTQDWRVLGQSCRSCMHIAMQDSGSGNYPMWSVSTAHPHASRGCSCYSIQFRGGVLGFHLPSGLVRLHDNPTFWDIVHFTPWPIVIAIIIWLIYFWLTSLRLLLWKMLVSFHLLTDNEAKLLAHNELHPGCSWAGL